MNTFTHSTTPVGPTCGRPRLSILPWHEAARSAAQPGLKLLSPRLMPRLLLLLLGLVLFSTTLSIVAQTPPYCGNSSGGFVSGDPGENEEDEECPEDGSGGGGPGRQ